ncbi:MAG: hypothetical protein KJN67_04450 [Pontiella sp.]|nr:hypothetical protein [Pontiella sp.]
MALISQLSVNLTANTKGLEKGFKRAKRKLKGFTDSIFNIKTAVAGALGIGGIGAMVGDLVAVNSEMQRLKSGLKTVTGSAENAAKAFDFIKEFSTTTPFELNEVTTAFVKLKNYGLEPSARALTAYGNMASAMGKSLDQMIEAMADATTGEMERMKEFGIRAAAIKDSTDKIMTFRGKETRVALRDIESYIMNIAESNFGGAMADQMSNLGPSFSNLRTAIQDLKVSIGEGGLNDAIAELVNRTTEFINTLDRSKIKEWTGDIMRGFADLIESTQGLYNYISGNKFLAYGGIVGYLLYGRTGLAIVAGLDFGTHWMGKAWEKGYYQSTPSDITGRQDLSDYDGNGYQLGDLNKHLESSNQELNVLNDSAKTQQQKQDETNDILRNIPGAIADVLRESAGPATAG